MKGDKSSYASISLSFQKKIKLISFHLILQFGFYKITTSTPHPFKNNPPDFYDSDFYEIMRGDKSSYILLSPLIIS